MVPLPEQLQVNYNQERKKQKKKFTIYRLILLPIKKNHTHTRKTH